METFLGRTISGLPVVEGDGAVGMLTETDALHALRRAISAAPALA